MNDGRSLIDELPFSVGKRLPGRSQGEELFSLRKRGYLLVWQNVWLGVHGHKRVLNRLESEMASLLVGSNFFCQNGTGRKRRTE